MKKVTLKYPDPVITQDEVFTARNQDPKVRKVESRGKPILNYRIEEAKFDQDGNTIPQVDPPFYQTTGRSLEWSIEPGQELAFPEYVANYLKKIYDFLEIVEPKLEETGEVESKPTENFVPTVFAEAKPVEGNVTCPICGQNFRNSKALGLHYAGRHPEKLTS